MQVLFNFKNKIKKGPLFGGPFFGIYSQNRVNSLLCKVRIGVIRTRLRLLIDKSKIRNFN
jgi:hypothetical protein